jgi:hypothetical protein
MTGTSHNGRLKTTLGLALTISAIAPAAASARIDLNPTGPYSSVAPPALAVHAVAHHAALPAAHMRANPDPPRVVVGAGSPSGGFDWADAAIGAAGGIGLTLMAVGGGRFVSAQRRAGRPSRSAAATSA